MCEKVKLTQEQADAVENFRQGVSDETIIEAHVSESGRGWRGNMKSINNLDLITLVDALRIGYEVEPEFKVGDWVVTSDFLEPIRKVKEVNDRLLVDNTGIVWRDFGEIRHATPEEIAKEKQRRWWKSHNRDVWELKERDIIKDFLTETTHEVIKVWGCVGGSSIYEVTYYADFKLEKKDLKEQYRVVCFAEDRKDA